MEAISTGRNLSLKKFGESSDKDYKRLKDDEAKNAEPARSLEIGEKQWTRKGLHTDLIRMIMKVQMKVYELDESVSGEVKEEYVGRPVAESQGGGMGERVGRGGRGRGPRGGNDDRVDDLNGQGNDQGELMRM
ncbi:hypothetical protein Tco_1076400 [Tanacetum coccineum]